LEHGTYNQTEQFDLQSQNIQNFPKTQVQQQQHKTNYSVNPMNDNTPTQNQILPELNSTQGAFIPECFSDEFEVTLPDLIPPAQHTVPRINTKPQVQHVAPNNLRPQTQHAVPRINSNPQVQNVAPRINS
jgi:hypothetical protein